MFKKQDLLNDEEHSLLEIIVDEISKPLDPLNPIELLEYIPIQYIVEYIKQYKDDSLYGFDGFIFR